jgi:N-acetylmuramoyl-L-alanine amidase
MRIENHRLVGGEEHGFAPQYRPDNLADGKLDAGGWLPLEGLVVVVHYAVTKTIAQRVEAVLQARDFVSCHVMLDRRGGIVQMVPFDRAARHAGQSVYKGRSNVNAFSLGIEIAHPGPLERRGDKFFTTWGEEWTEGVHEGWHVNDTARRGWRYWATYSEEEFKLCLALC